MKFESPFEQDPVVPYLRSPHDPKFLTDPQVLQDDEVRIAAWEDLELRVLSGTPAEMANDQELYEQMLDDTHLTLRGLARRLDSGLHPSHYLGFGFQLLEGRGSRANRATSLYVNEEDAVVVRLEDRASSSMLAVAMLKGKRDARPLSAVQAERLGDSGVQEVYAHAGWRVAYGDPAEQRRTAFDGLQVAVSGLKAAYMGDEWPETPAHFLDRYLVA